MTLSRTVHVSLNLYSPLGLLTLCIHKERNTPLYKDNMTYTVRRISYPRGRETRVNKRG